MAERSGKRADGKLPGDEKKGAGGASAVAGSDADSSSYEALERQLEKLRKHMAALTKIMVAVLVIVIAVSVFYIGQLSDFLNGLVDSVNQQASFTVTLNRSSLLSADYLAIVIPLLIAVVGGALAFFGRDRLNAYDERIDSMRQGLSAEIGSRVEQATTASQTALRDDITKQVEERLTRIYCPT